MSELIYVAYRVERNSHFSSCAPHIYATSQKKQFTCTSRIYLHICYVILQWKKMYYQNNVSLQMTRHRKQRSKVRVYCPAEISLFFIISRPAVCPNLSPAQTGKKEFFWWQSTPAVKLTPHLHVVLKIRMPEATVCTLPYAFRVWSLMKLKNTLISSLFFFLTDSEHNQELFFGCGGMCRNHL